jgi:hypothetical protein
MLMKFLGWMTLNSQRHQWITDRCGDSAKIVWVSVETSASNPLSEFIKIYDDDESPEVSLGTPVHIEEEKGPEKTYSPIPRGPNQGGPTKEKEVESVLDTKVPDALETQEDSLRSS